MDAELKAAAERLANRDLAHYQGPTGDDTDMRAGIMLARAYLAKLAVDDLTDEEYERRWAAENGKRLRIVDLERQLAACREALEPFAKYAALFPADDDHWMIAPIKGARPNTGDCRRAAAVLAATKEESND